MSFSRRAIETHKNNYRGGYQAVTADKRQFSTVPFCDALSIYLDMLSFRATQRGPFQSVSRVVW